MPSLIEKRILEKQKGDEKFTKENVREAVELFFGAHKSGLRALSKLDNTQMETSSHYHVAMRMVRNEFDRLKKVGLSVMEAVALTTMPDFYPLKTYFVLPKHPKGRTNITLPFAFWYDYYLKGKLPSKKKFFEEVFPELVFGTIKASEKFFGNFPTKFARSFSYARFENFKENYFRYVNKYDECPDGNSLIPGKPGVVCVPVTEVEKLYRDLENYKRGKRLKIIPEVESAVFGATVRIHEFKERNTMAIKLLKRFGIRGTNLAVAPMREIVPLLIHIYDENGLVSKEAIESIINEKPYYLKFDKVVEVYLPMMRPYVSVVVAGNAGGDNYYVFVFPSDERTIKVPSGVDGKVLNVAERIAKKSGRKLVIV